MKTPRTKTGRAIQAAMQSTPQEIARETAIAVQADIYSMRAARQTIHPLSTLKMIVRRLGWSLITITR